MSEKKRVYIRYFTKEKKAKINPDNIKAYDRYLKSNILKDTSVAETTYKTYRNYFNQFLVFLEEEYENVHLYDPDMLENAVNILEDFMTFCSSTLGNNKKVINTKVSAISSFYHWSVKRGEGKMKVHPFDKKLDRMKGAKDEKLIGHHFLDGAQIEAISSHLVEDSKKDKGRKFDIQDRLMWHIALDSANRLGALAKLTVSSLNLENMTFEDIREKGGKMVEAPFTDETKVIIEEWLELRKDLDDLKCDAMFMVKYNGEYKKMSTTSIYKRVKKMGTIIGLDDFRPHCIRKTQLNRVYEITGDITMAQELGNHNSAETTIQSYVRPKSKSEVRDKLNNMMKKSL